MSMPPLIDGGLFGIFKGLNDFQSSTKCAAFELRAADCLEAYGRDHWHGKCQDYVEDFRECKLRCKQMMRVRLMRLERRRQWEAGERDTYYAPEPPEGAF